MKHRPHGKTSTTDRAQLERAEREAEDRGASLSLKRRLGTSKATRKPVAVSLAPVSKWSDDAPE